MDREKLKSFHHHKTPSSAFPLWLVKSHHIESLWVHAPLFSPTLLVRHNGKLSVFPHKCIKFLHFMPQWSMDNLQYFSSSHSHRVPIPQCYSFLLPLKACGQSYAFQNCNSLMFFIKPLPLVGFHSCLRGTPWAVHPAFHPQGVMACLHSCEADRIAPLGCQTNCREVAFLPGCSPGWLLIKS